MQSNSQQLSEQCARASPARTSGAQASFPQWTTSIDDLSYAFSPNLDSGPFDPFGSDQDYYGFLIDDYGPGLSTSNATNSFAHPDVPFPGAVPHPFTSPLAVTDGRLAIPVVYPSVTSPITGPTASSSPPTTCSASSKRPAVSAPEDEAIVSKRRRNNAAAAKYRQKKIDRISELEQELKAVSADRDELRLELARREVEIEVLRSLIAHGKATK